MAEKWATAIDDGARVPRGDLYQFVVEGHVVPYVRMTRRGKYVSTRAQRYLAWQERARWRLREQMQCEGWEMIPKRTPFSVRVLFVPVRHMADLDNQAKAVVDAAQSVVFPNDLWMDELYASRATGGPERFVLYVRWPA